MTRFIELTSMDGQKFTASVLCIRYVIDMKTHSKILYTNGDAADVKELYCEVKDLVSGKTNNV